jgi:hypothetical protein
MYPIQHMQNQQIFCAFRKMRFIRGQMSILRLTQSLGFTARGLRQVPRALSDAWKAQRVTLSRQLLQTLEMQHDRAWHDIV